MSALHSSTSYGVPSARRAAPSRPGTVRYLRQPQRPISRPNSTAKPVHRVATSRTSQQTVTGAPPQFFAFILCILVAGILLSLFINTFVQQASFHKTDLQRSITNATAMKQQLETEIAAAESPQHLMSQAKKMGMVPANNPVFLRLSDQQILGKRIPAGKTQ